MKTSIIITTYNEEDTIFEVVAACCKHNPDSEIIVVDDGSTDKTEALLDTLALHYSFEYLKLDANYGKGYSIARGAEFATGDVLMFINANLSKLRKNHFQNLFAPLLKGEVDLVLGIPSEVLINYKSAPFNSLTGEAIMLKDDLIPVIHDLREMRYGVEDFIGLYYQLTRKSVKYVLLDGVKYISRKTDIKKQKVNSELSHDTANLVLTNKDLINKRAQNRISKTDNYTKSTISCVQYELNNKMRSITESIV